MIQEAVYNGHGRVDRVHGLNFTCEKCGYISHVYKKVETCKLISEEHKTLCRKSKIRKARRSR